MNRQPVYIFEDDDYEKFLPLTMNRAVFQLRLGIDLLFEKWRWCFRDREMRFCLRGAIADPVMSGTGLRCNDFGDIGRTGATFVNGRFIADEDLVTAIGGDGGAGLLICDGNLVAAVIPSDSEEARNLALMGFWGYGHFKAIVRNLPKADVRAREVKHIWDFLKLNSEQICRDFDRLVGDLRDGIVSQDAGVDSTCLIHDRDRVCIREKAVIDGQVVIDAGGGPVYIDSGAAVLPHTHIAGPCYVGRATSLVGGKIREGCSIGPMCKVGGEIEGTIMLGYSNKFHDGFMGHSYIGEWVNLGAMTTNSDLKNNYGSVRVDQGAGQVDTGMMKVGSFMGDHVKTGIGTMLTTGITIGFASNLFGAGHVADKFVPPFCWGGTGRYVEHDVERAIATARTVMERRGVDFTESDRRLFVSVFEQTARQRERVTGK